MPLVWKWSVEVDMVTFEQEWGDRGDMGRGCQYGHGAFSVGKGCQGRHSALGAGIGW